MALLSTFSRSRAESALPVKVSSHDHDATERLGKALYEQFSTLSPWRELVLVCIGTDRSTGDSLGPLVGTKLSLAEQKGFALFGTLDEPVHAVNLQDTVSLIERNFAHPYIVAVDACLGQSASVGHIRLDSGPVKPGAGVNKDLPPIGDIHMTGIVNVGGFMEYFVLQNTRLSIVMKMSQIIAGSLLAAISAWRSATGLTIASDLPLPESFGFPPE
ncbi:MAG TPA: spore protease YyaC [Bacilli bacterium]